MEAALRAIGSQVRLEIIEVIGTGEVASGDISARVGCSPSLTSQHLQILKEAGLVLVRVDARRRLYRVDFARLAEVRAFLDGFWGPALAELKSKAEAEAGPENAP